MIFIVLVSVSAVSAAMKGAYDAASTNYKVLSPLGSGQERVRCLARGYCNDKILTCPKECPQRKPQMNKKEKACFIDCSSKCEVTCKCKCPKMYFVTLMDVRFLTHLDWFVLFEQGG